MLVIVVLLVFWANNKFKYIDIKIYTKRFNINPYSNSGYI